MPTPINSVRTRVIEEADGGYMAQLSTDGMMWADLPDPAFFGLCYGNMDKAAYYAKCVALAASRLPSTGKIVWAGNG